MARQLPDGCALLFCPGCRGVLYAMGTREAGMVAGCTACKFWVAPPNYSERVGQLAEWLLAKGAAGRWPTLQEVYDEAVRLGLPARPPTGEPAKEQG